MKTLQKFLQENPSYVKCGVERIAQVTGLSTTTVKRFKNTDTFKSINRSYRQK